MLPDFQLTPELHADRLTVPSYLTLSLILGSIALFCLYALHRHPRPLFLPCKTFNTNRIHRRSRHPAGESQEGLWGSDASESNSSNGSTIYLSDLKRQVSTIPPPSPSPASKERRDTARTISSFGQPWPASLDLPRGSYGPVAQPARSPPCSTRYETGRNPVAPPRGPPSYPPPSHTPQRPMKSPSPPHANMSPARSSPLRQSDTPASVRQQLEDTMKGSKGRVLSKPPPPRMREEDRGYCDVPVGRAI